MPLSPLFQIFFSVFTGQDLIGGPASEAIVVGDDVAF